MNKSMTIKAGGRAAVSQDEATALREQSSRPACEVRAHSSLSAAGCSSRSRRHGGCLALSFEQPIWIKSVSVSC
jgi:hypothetical protein